MKPINRLWWQTLRVLISVDNAKDAAKEERDGLARLNDALARNCEAWEQSTKTKNYPRFKER